MSEPVSGSNGYSEAKRRYIEEMGLLMESYGVSRMSGRVLGALLVAEPAEKTAEDLARVLKASRSSISVAIRLLERVGYVERISKPGERKDYFRNRPNAWSKLTEQQLEVVRQFKQMARRGLELLETDDPEARRGLAEMLEFYEFFEQEHPKILEHWRERQRKRRNGK